MIAHRAISIDDAVLMLKNRSRHATNFRAGMKNVEWKECPEFFPQPRMVLLKPRHESVPGSFGQQKE